MRHSGEKGKKRELRYVTGCSRCSGDTVLIRRAQWEFLSKITELQIKGDATAEPSDTANMPSRVLMRHKTRGLPSTAIEWRKQGAESAFPRPGLNIGTPFEQTRSDCKCFLRLRLRDVPEISDDDAIRRPRSLTGGPRPKPITTRPDEMGRNRKIHQPSVNSRQNDDNPTKSMYESRVCASCTVATAAGP